MIYLEQMGRGDLVECRTVEEALGVISRMQLLPSSLRIWRADDPLITITFEDLQQMAGHDPLDIASVDHGVDVILAAVNGALVKRGLCVVEYTSKRLTSTSGLPCGHASVERLYGNPCVKVTLGLTMNAHLADDPRPLGPAELREIVLDVSYRPGLEGWGMVYSECSNVMHIPGAKPWRDIVMWLSRPRSAFDAPPETPCPEEP